ncbi:hypothetical protein PG996_014104 [Apiospora saccharicola]|uniref:Uncharacterized protein n=1 Tax=Apiospora saccharicola TaxID=335842 RepID=A0ABR1TJE0_9PEZI
MQAYATPSIATITGGGYEVPIASAVALLSEAPALLTRYTPPPGCATDWYWDTTVGAAAPIPSAAAAPGSAAEAQQSRSSVIFSDRAHNGEGWATCQPYRVAARATYSAGVCPDRSAFMTVSKITKVPGPSDAFYLGACCATTATLSAYPGNNNKNGGVLGATQYACVGIQENVVATRWLDDHRSVLERATGTVTAVADPLYMVWHESDLALHPESDANSLRAAMGMDAGTVTSSTAEPTPAMTLTPEPRSSFPAGAIAGIATAFVICVLAISFLGFVAFSRRGKQWRERRRDNGRSDNHSADDRHGNGPPTRQLGGESSNGTFASVESHAPSGPELQGQGLKGPAIMQSSREIRDSPSTADTSHFRDEFGEAEQKVLLNRC